MQPRRITRIALPLLLALVIAPASAPAQEEPEVNVAVRSNEVFVGEAFVFQIQVENVDSVDPPDLASATADFDVEYSSGSLSQSQSFTSINGQNTVVSRRTYLMNFQLKARRAGNLTIPSLQLAIGGKSYTTRPVSIRANAAQEVADFKLVHTLAKDTCYVGEPIELTTTLYIGREMTIPSFSMPGLASNILASEPIALPKKSELAYFDIDVNGVEVTSERSKGSLDGRDYTTLMMKHIIVPKSAGEVTLASSTASFSAVTSRRQRSRSLFDDFSLLGQKNYENIVVPGNDLTLTVKPLPEAGRPADYSGLVGRYTLSATASPTNVNVGDPITLTLALNGSEYLKHFEFPSLQKQHALAEEFRIPDEMAPGRMDGKLKVFTQTIRAQAAVVKEIPPVTLTYFDSDQGAYVTAATQPIPLTVRDVQVVTASDAEGYQRPVETVEHIAVDAGIAHNFTEADCLRPQRFGPDEWMHTAGSWLLLLLPPALFVVLASFRVYQKYGGGRAAERNRKQAAARLEAALAGAAGGSDPYGPALEALREYVGIKLGLNASALTFADARAPLAARGASAESLAALERVFNTCEAHRYSGGASSAASASEFLDTVRSTVRALDKEIGS